VFGGGLEGGRRQACNQLPIVGESPTVSTTIRIANAAQVRAAQETTGMHTTFPPKKPLPREQRRALQKRLRQLLADQEFLETRINARTDPTVQKYLAPIKAEITAIEAQL
jgi:hypothetical protein